MVRQSAQLSLNCAVFLHHFFERSLIFIDKQLIDHFPGHNSLVFFAEFFLSIASIHFPTSIKQMNFSNELKLNRMDEKKLSGCFFWIAIAIQAIQKCSNFRICNIVHINLLTLSMLCVSVRLRLRDFFPFAKVYSYFCCSKHINLS